MERLLPAETAEPIVRGGGGITALRTVTYLLLATAVAVGVWLRFNAEIAAVLPGLAAPDAQVGAVVPPSGLIDLAVLPSGKVEAAVSSMGLQGGDSALMLQALREGRLRLVRMPLVDATSPFSAGQGLSGRGGPPQFGPSAHTVMLSTGGYTTTVQLTRTPLAVTLPVGPQGQVSFSTPGSDPVGIGALGLSGPVRLPDLVPGQLLSVGVVAQ